MVKFRAGDLLGFGLSKLNIEKLQQKKPISIDMSEMEIPGEVTFSGKKIMIFYGETEQDMQNELSEFINHETKYSSTMDN